jgi:hypothetical protein
MIPGGGGFGSRLSGQGDGLDDGLEEGPDRCGGNREQDRPVKLGTRGARRQPVHPGQNVADFAAERDLVLVFVLKKNLPAGGGQAAALARVLDRWDRDHPDPYLGHLWPAMD